MADTPAADLTAVVSGFRAAYVAVAILLSAAALLILTLLRRPHVAVLDSPTPGDLNEN